MKILVTNDDGILAPGIMTLVKALKEKWDVTVIAPDRNNSGVSSAISLETPLRITEVRENWFQLNGTPADCVKLGVGGFLSEVPDIVVSGINAGANLGDDVWYSGTVGGAFEGRYLKYPPVAVSCVYEGFETHDGTWFYETAAEMTVNLLEHIIASQKFPEETLLNMNVPNLPRAALKGCKVTRQGSRHCSEPLIAHRDGRDKPIYWIGHAGKIKDDSEGTDFRSIQDGFASVTPLTVDLTSYDQMDTVKGWLCRGI